MREEGRAIGRRRLEARKPPLRLLGPALRARNERWDAVGLRMDVRIPRLAVRPWLGDVTADFRLATRVAPLERTWVRVRLI